MRAARHIVAAHESTNPALSPVGGGTPPHPHFRPVERAQ